MTSKPHTLPVVPELKFAEELSKEVDRLAELGWAREEGSVGRPSGFPKVSPALAKAIAVSPLTLKRWLSGTRVPTRSEQIGVIHLIKAIKTGPEKFKPAKPPANFAAQLSEELKRLRELRYRQEQLWEWTDVSANSLTKAWPKGNRVPLLCAQIGVLALLRELK